MIFRSNTLLPISASPICDGAVWIEAGVIRKVGTFADLRGHANGAVIDARDSVVLPGLINAHCHLELTNMAGRVSRGESFSDWLRQIVAQKKGWQQQDYEQSAQRGAQMLLQSGTTSVCDIVSWWPLAAQLQTTKLRA